MTLHANHNLTFFPFALLPNLRPVTLEDITPDGNCLFRSLSFFLTGLQGIYYQQLRQIICNEMSHIPFSPLQIMAHLNPSFPSFTIQEYLNKENMHHDSVYGGDVEIAAFCYNFKAKVVIFVESPAVKKWFIFDQFVNSNAPTFFLYHTLNHFQPILQIDCLPETDIDFGLRSITNDFVLLEPKCNDCSSTSKEFVRTGPIKEILNNTKKEIEKCSIKIYKFAGKHNPI